MYILMIESAASSGSRWPTCEKIGSPKPSRGEHHHNISHLVSIAHESGNDHQHLPPLILQLVNYLLHQRPFQLYVCEHCHLRKSRCNQYAPPDFRKCVAPCLLHNIHFLKQTVILQFISLPCTIISFLFRMGVTCTIQMQQCSYFQLVACM